MSDSSRQPTPFRVEARASEAGPVAILVAGELDGANAHQLNEALRGPQEEARPVAIDLTLCQFIDSSGLAALLLAYRRSVADGLEFRVYGAAEQVRRMLEVCGLSEQDLLAGGSPGTTA